MTEQSKTVILKHSEILQKIDRIAWQILEDNYDREEIVLIGIQHKGTVISELLGQALERISDKRVVQGSVFDGSNSVVQLSNGTGVVCARLQCGLETRMITTSSLPVACAHFSMALLL